MSILLRAHTRQVVDRQSTVTKSPPMQRQPQPPRKYVAKRSMGISQKSNPETPLHHYHARSAHADDDPSVTSNSRDQSITRRG